MRFNNYLKEEYLTIMGKMSIFVNPTTTEIGKFGKYSIRFIADHRTKELFIWDGERELHIDVLNYLIDKDKLEPVSATDIWKSSDLLTGVAYNKAGKLDFSTSDQIFGDLRCRDCRVYEYIKNMMENDWSWLKPYFTSIGFISDIEKKLK